jgi:putative PIN family toxin of toxin-antitoxin system
MTRRERWVIDTNVWVSALLWQGTPGRVIELAGEQEVRLITSRALLNELSATLAKKKLARHVQATGLTADQMRANVRRLVTIVQPHPLQAPVARDADDDAVLACAVAARADLIVSGDDDLLSLARFAGIAIVTAAQAVRRIDPSA